MCYGNLELFTPTCVTFCHSREKTVVENFAIKYEILIDFKCILIKESFKKPKTKNQKPLTWALPDDCSI